MRRRRIIRNRIIAVLIAFLAVLLLCSFFTEPDKLPEVKVWESYIIKPGDTLWKLTREIYGDSCDIRRMIDIIAEENEINAGRISAGDVILLPVVE